MGVVYYVDGVSRAMSVDAVGWWMRMGFVMDGSSDLEVVC
jgi:hypothetical protein